MISYHTWYKDAQVRAVKYLSHSTPSWGPTRCCSAVNFHTVNRCLSVVYLVPLVFAFLCFWLVNSLFTVAPMHSDEGLAIVSNCKRMVLCLTEKTCVLDVLLSVRCYGATSSMLISWQWIHPEKGKVKSLNTVRLTQEVLNKHLSCKKQLWKGGKVANFVHSWDHN